jgi:hypothetical protein
MSAGRPSCRRNEVELQAVLLNLYFNPEEGGDELLEKSLLTLDRLHGAMSNETGGFMLTVVRASNHKQKESREFDLQN